MSDIDRARHEADERLDTILGQLEPGDPRVRLALRSMEHHSWQEQGLVEQGDELWSNAPGVRLGGEFQQRLQCG